MELALAELRAFNRFYTRFSGALDSRFLDSDMALVAVRLLHEIAHREGPVASELQQDLNLDAGYVSRILRDFEERGWIVRGRGDDARRRPIRLTNEGHATFDMLERRQQDVTAEQLAPLTKHDRRTLIAALGTTRGLLERRQETPVTLRTFRAGDLGMMTARQAILYAETQGWGRPVEMLFCKITLGFLRNFKPDREQCWIAEMGGRMVGSVLFVDDGEGYARLRMFYVEPDARGRGVGAMLLRQCISFARTLGYRGIWLWTHKVLTHDRRLYRAAGFKLIASEAHDAFDGPVDSETWKLNFDQPTIGVADSDDEIAAVATLFEAYAKSLDVDLAYQGFADELARLPGAYVKPLGALLLARGGDGTALGCVALRPTAREGIGEMKRLFVSPAARGTRLGRRLAEAAIAEAGAIGYRAIVLDTLASMAAAQGLYRDLGFVPTDPYYDTPVAGTAFLRLDLR